jgi:hypothetical protein
VAGEEGVEHGALVGGQAAQRGAGWLAVVGEEDAAGGPGAGGEAPAGDVEPADPPVFDLHPYVQRSARLRPVSWPDASMTLSTTEVPATNRIYQRSRMRGR